MSERSMVADYVWSQCVKAFNAGDIEKAQRYEGFHTVLTSMTDTEYLAPVGIEATA